MLLPPNFSYCCFYRDYRRINTFQSMTNQDNSVILVCSSPLARMLQLYRNLSAWRMLSEVLLSQVLGLSQPYPELPWPQWNGWTCCSVWTFHRPLFRLGTVPETPVGLCFSSFGLGWLIGNRQYDSSPFAATDLIYMHHNYFAISLFVTVWADIHFASENCRG